QVLPAEAEVAERPTPGPDAVGDAADRGEGGGEREPADQGRSLARVQDLALGDGWAAAGPGRTAVERDGRVTVARPRPGVAAGWGGRRPGLRDGVVAHS